MTSGDPETGIVNFQWHRPSCCCWVLLWVQGYFQCGVTAGALHDWGSEGCWPGLGVRPLVQCTNVHFWFVRRSWQGQQLAASAASTAPGARHQLRCLGLTHPSLWPPPEVGVTLRSHQRVEAVPEQGFFYKSFLCIECIRTSEFYLFWLALPKAHYCTICVTVLWNNECKTGVEITGKRCFQISEEWILFDWQVTVVIAPHILFWHAQNKMIETQYNRTQ